MANLWEEDAPPPEAAAVAAAPATGDPQTDLWMQDAPPLESRGAVGDKPDYLKDLADARRAQTGDMDAGMRGMTLGWSDKLSALLDAGNQLVFAPKDQQLPFWDAYHHALDLTKTESDQYQSDHPVLSRVAYGAGTLMLPFKAAGEAAAAPATTSLPYVMGRSAAVGTGVGGVAGLGSSDDKSLTSDLESTGIGAAGGAILGGAAPLVGRLISPISDRVAQWWRGAPAVEDQAYGELGGRLKNEALARIPSTASAAEKQAALDAYQRQLTGDLDVAGKPLAIADVAGAETRGLVGDAVRSPGSGRQYAEDFIRGRDNTAELRGQEDVGVGLGRDSAVSTTEQLLNERSAAARPLYDEAMQGGSIAPLQDQLRTSVQKATSAKAQIARQMQQIEQENPGALAARGAAGAGVRAQYMDLNAQLQQAESDRQATLAMFQRSQNDASSNAPGAVWNPRIQQFLDHPEVQQGIQKGIAIQRNEALAEGRPFNPTEYAITGVDENGKAVVGNVPNMRLLDSAKKGLDAIVSDNRDAVTGRLNEYGRSVDMVRRAFLEQLDAANPAYATARQAWAGKSASLDAIKFGQGLLDPSVSADEVAQQLAHISPADRDFVKLGVAQRARTMMANTGKTGDESNWLLGKGPMGAPVQKVMQLFSSPQEFNAWAQRAEAEQKMFRTGTSLFGNSATQGRLAEAASRGHGEGGIAGGVATAATGLASGELGLTSIGAGRALGGLRRWAMEPTPAVNEQIARIGLNSNLAANRQALIRAFASARAPQAISPVVPLSGALSGPGVPTLPYHPGQQP